MRDVPTLIIVLNEDGQGPQAPVHNHTTNRLAHTHTHSRKAICAAFEKPAINTLSWQGPQMRCWELCPSRHLIPSLLSLSLSSLSKIH